jgi:hypothetical protein
MIPTRIQRKRMKGARMLPGTVYVGRPSRWGNPFLIGTHGYISHTREEAVRMFRCYARERLADDPHWLDPLREAKYLACWCAEDDPNCHGDVLIELLKETA